MDQITLKDFRCFHERQSARLAPLTLVVGDNSTGKTSFMAMVRALWEVAYRDAIPDFTEEPYDLGSYSEIAHHRGGSAGRADAFEAGFRLPRERRGSEPITFDVKFEQRGTAAVPVRRRIAKGAACLTVEQANGAQKVTISTGKSAKSSAMDWPFGADDETQLVPLHHVYAYARIDERWSSRESEAAFGLASLVFGSLESRPFASAPVRSKPRRTYDPARPARDPEGDYVPMYLARLYRRNKRAWGKLKKRLESFGVDAGLFDELSIKSFGASASEPFQVQVRKRGATRKGPWRNLIDVGYGVSQVLPLITELLRPDAPSIFLLQQPEVHLHPSAQAALGSLFCHAAAEGDRQLIVETHSDHLINRVRMDVRDGTVPLAPDDVSILYFERDELAVRIHSLRLDRQGNVLGAPPSYGSFFMAETARSLAY